MSKARSAPRPKMVAALVGAAVLTPTMAFAQTVPGIPPLLETLTVARNPTGTANSFQVGGATVTTNNAFFQSLGTNGRSCVTCHDPQAGWSVTPRGVNARFQATQGADPLFRLIDGATCSTASVATATTQLRAYSLLLGKGLFRIALPVPANAQFSVSVTSDPYDCNTNASTGLISPTSGTLSVYRRPLPSTNQRFQTSVMWDGREASLTTQAINATLGHAQAVSAPTLAQQAQMVAFESGLYTAQATDTTAGALNALGATGGVTTLAQQPFTVGVNDSANPNGFDRVVFKLYTAWQSLTGADAATQARRSIARGEQIFNTRAFTINNVPGLTTAANTSVRGSCSTCHDTPNVGNHSVSALMNIGVSRADPARALDVSALPVFTLTCTAGPLAGRTFTVTDPGQAMVTGRCSDIGRMKVPVLRGLAARAPYFHNGSAATLGAVVGFYNGRFNLGLSAQERADLVNFLQAL
jgi:cytochrome c peroxidase